MSLKPERKARTMSRHNLGEVQLYVRSMGRMLKITGVFTDVDAANRHMERTNDALVAETPSGLLLLADKNDQGAKVSQ
jgi:hypothetical protein